MPPQNDDSTIESEDGNGYNEHSPLLPSDRRESFRHTPVVLQAHSPMAIISILSVTIFVIMCGSFLIAVPQARVFEDIICHHYYGRMARSSKTVFIGPIDESLCKGDEVQSELAMLMGVLEMLNNIPGVWPTSRTQWVGTHILSRKHRIGRKRVLFLAVGGSIAAQIWMFLICWFWLVFPIKLIWTSSFFMFIGGGDKVLSSIIYVLGSDVSTETTRANNFFIIGCATLLPEFIAPTIASILMKRSPWIPIMCGIALEMFGALGFSFIPETLQLHAVNGTTTPITSDLASVSSSHSQRVKIDDSTTLATCISYAKIQWHKLHSATKILHSIPAMLLLVTFVPQPVQRSAIDLSVRYISKRFSWSLAKSGFLLSVRAGVNIIVLAILPGISYLLTVQPSTHSRFSRFALGLSDHAKDLVLARGSLLFLVGGLVLLAAAPHVVAAIVALIVVTLGSGFTFFCRALITNLVDQQHVARLYTTIAVVETIGAIPGSPTLAALYTAGIRRAKADGAVAWLGLPYWVFAAYVALSGVGVWILSSDADKFKNKPEDALEPEDLIG
ncbi:MAG: hypothetical protein M1818_002665 [Claussenomyces sp. TS43310]|nr:MAG: hypothetical protein M1818_002665 [Claussenomyces sp. TS43310]